MKAEEFEVMSLDSNKAEFTTSPFALIIGLLTPSILKA